MHSALLVALLWAASVTVAEDLHFSWVTRPLQYAAPGAELPVQPVAALLDGTAPLISNSGPGPGFCTAQLTSLLSPHGRAVVTLTGQRSQPLHQSVCVFGGLGVAVNSSILRSTSVPTDGYLDAMLHICATSSRDSSEPRSVCNTTTIQIPLSCPAFQDSSFSGARIFSVSPRIQEAAPSDGSLGSITITGSRFNWHSRHALSCIFRSAAGDRSELRSTATLVDLCTVTCPVPDTYAAFHGYVGIEESGLELQSACPTLEGVAEPPTTCGEAALMNSTGCLISIYSRSAERALFVTQEPPLTVPSIVVDGSDVALVPVQLRMCDAFGNVIPSRLVDANFSVGYPGGSVANRSDYADGYTISLTNVDFPPVAETSVIGPGQAICNAVARSRGPSVDGTVPRTVPLLLSPNALFGWYRASNNSFVVDAMADELACMILDTGLPATLNVSVERLRADTITPFPIVVSARDASGRQIVGPMEPPATAVVVVETTEGSLREQFETLATHFPLELESLIYFSAPGNWTVTVSLEGGPSARADGEVTVRSCPASIARARGIVDVWTEYRDTNVCGVPQRLRLDRRVYMDSLAATTVTVRGALFDYRAADEVSCHFSNISEPWSSDVSGWRATFVSSCEVLCEIPPQFFPIRDQGSSAVTRIDGRPVVVSTDELSHPVGELRVRQQLPVAEGDNVNAAPWSNPLTVDVIGAGARAKVTNWDENVYPRRANTTFDPITVAVEDLLGSSLLGIDPIPRRITLYSQVRARQLLNASGETRAEVGTCIPQPGVATFKGVYVLEPQSGEYALYFTGTGLAEETAEVLHIRSTEVQLDHYLQLQNVPLPFTDRSLLADANGLLPIQPIVDIFLKGKPSAPDVQVSDIPLIAIVVPEDPDEPLDPSRGIGLQDASSRFGNVASFALGIARFTTLRFSGIEGHWYTITFRMLNSTLKVEDVSIRVYTPMCPLEGGEGDAPLIDFGSAPNASLSLGVGTVIKGWKFERPETLARKQAFTCTLRNMTLPARFIDVCTIKCFVPPEEAVVESVSSLVDICPMSPCCYDNSTGESRCSFPFTSALSVRVPVGMRDAKGNEIDVSVEEVSPLSRQNFTVLGVPVGLRVVANVESNLTIRRNEQVVVSSVVSPLSGIIVEFFDTEDKPVGRTDRMLRPVTVISIRRMKTELTVPASYDKIVDKLKGVALNETEPGSCFFEGHESRTPSLEGLRRGIAVNGTFSFEQLRLRLPPAGAYGITIVALPPLAGDDLASYLADPASFLADNRWWDRQLSTSVSDDFTTTSMAQVVPGNPVQLCLYTDLAGERVSGDTINRQPVLMLLDAAQNIIQPLDRDLDLRDRTDVLDIERFDRSLFVSTNLTVREYDYSRSTGIGEFQFLATIDETLGGRVRVDSNDFADNLALFTASFKQLKVIDTTFNNEYVLVFSAVYESDSDGPVTLQPPRQVSSAPLLRKDCGLNEYGERNSARCLPCPSGLQHCIGGPTTRCFLCNGSTGLNVTNGYWRYSTFSETAYHCSTGGVCLGDTELGTCGDKYLNHEPLCAVCEPSYARDILGTCVDCAPPWVSIVVLLLFFLAGAVVLLIFIIVTLKEDGYENTDHSLVLMLKIFINFVQVAGMLGEFEVNFPSYVSAYFNFVAASSGGKGISISPVNCLFPSMTYLNKLLIQLAAPPIILFFIALAILASGSRKRRREARHAAAAGVTLVAVDSDFDSDSEEGDPPADDNAQLGIDAKRKERAARRLRRLQNQMPDCDVRRRKVRLFNADVFITTAVILLFITYQTIVSQCIDTFRCEELDTGIDGSAPLKVLRSDARVDCRSVVYQRHVAVAMYGLFVYGVLLPLGGMILVMKIVQRYSNASNMSGDASKAAEPDDRGWFEANKTFSFLIRGFRLRFWFWEFVIVFRKILIRVILSAIEDATLQALLGIWTLTGLFLLHAYTRPYVKILHNRAEGLGLLTLVVTLNFGILFRNTQLTSGDVCGPTCGFVVVLLISMNAAVIVFFVVNIVRALIDRVVEMFGVDRLDGSRWVSRRSFRRSILLLLGQEVRLAPSFQDYIPPFQDRELATQVLGEEDVVELEEAITDAAEFGKKKKARRDAGDEDEFILVGGRGDDDVVAKPGDKRDAKRSKKHGRGRDERGSSDSGGDAAATAAETDEDTDVDEAIDALFDEAAIPEAEGPAAVPDAADETKRVPIARPKRAASVIRFLSAHAQETGDSAVDAAKRARGAASDAAATAKDRAVEAAGAARDRTVAAATLATGAARELADNFSFSGKRGRQSSDRDDDLVGRLDEVEAEAAAAAAAEALVDPSADPEERERAIDEATDIAEDALAARRERQKAEQGSGTGSSKDVDSDDEDVAAEEDAAATFLRRLQGAGLPGP